MPAGERRPVSSPSLRVAVAASGGLDSTALLHCVARLAADTGLEVHALHVHHGLQPGADRWLEQVAAQCGRWRRQGRRLVFHAHRVVGQPAPGDSVESWARRVRYDALASMARAAGCGVVLLAHHRRDQAETVLLQALRGAGPAGLAAMPAAIERDGLLWLRPWLDHPREAIEAYARRWRLRTAHDPSNADARPARSRLRTRVWPALLAHFPDAEVALTAVARRAHEARVIVDAVAAQDLAIVAGPDGLRVADWVSLGEARRANVLRHWLKGIGHGDAPETLVRRLLGELPMVRDGRWPLPGGLLRMHAGCLTAQAVALAAPRPCLRVDLSSPGIYSWPGWPGRVHVLAVPSGGVPAAMLRDAQLRPRQGGERWQSHRRGVPRSLKKQFQDLGVPAWCRDGPLVTVDAGLVFVAGLGLDARALAWPGSPRVGLRWEP